MSRRGRGSGLATWEDWTSTLPTWTLSDLGSVNGLYVTRRLSYKPFTEPRSDNVQVGRVEVQSADLDVIRPWFGKWLVRHPEVEFVAAGDPRIHDYLGDVQAI